MEAGIGRYPVLFSTELKELEDEQRRKAELGGLWLCLYRGLMEIDDPSEMTKVIVRVSEESRRVVEGRGLSEEVI